MSTAASEQPGLRLVFDTSALLDLFGKWSDDHKQRRGDLVEEVRILAPLKSLMFSSRAIREEIREHMVIGGELDKYVAFESVENSELNTIPGFVPAREADYSLTVLCHRFEREGYRSFLITKDRTFLTDLPRAGCRALVIPPTGFAEALTVLVPRGSPAVKLAHKIQNNAFLNVSRAMRLVRQEQGQKAYEDWQEFLNSRTSAKHDFIEALKRTGIILS